jgi:hypothetical protein
MLEIKKMGDTTYIEWVDHDRFIRGIASFKASKNQKLLYTGGKIPWDKAKKSE